MNADVTLDLTGLSCPAPLLGAKRVLDDLKSGQVLMLISDCPGTFDDLSAWVKHTDHDLVSTEKVERSVARASQPRRFVEAIWRGDAGEGGAIWRIRFPSGVVLESSAPLTLEEALRLIDRLGGAS